MPKLKKPKQKDLKRRVRERMRKTGESYTAARSRVVAKKAAGADDAELAAKAGMSDAAVRAKTGRTWKQWVVALDRIGAASMPHADIARRLSVDFEVPDWWSQMVTVGYERIRGLRAKGQRRGGGYEVGKSRTFPVPIAELYAAFGERARKRWLGDAKLTVRKATAEKTMRMRWEDDTPIEAYFLSKGERKSTVQIQHRELESPSVAAKMRAYWGDRLDALADVLGGR